LLVAMTTSLRCPQLPDSSLSLFGLYAFMWIETEDRGPFRILWKKGKFIDKMHVVRTWKS
jgi:hypothetical protein